MEVSSTASTRRPATSGPSIRRCSPCALPSLRTTNASSVRPRRGRGVQHRGRHRVGAERQAPDGVVLEVVREVEHDLTDQRGGDAVEGHPPQVDVVVRLPSRGQHDPAVHDGLAGDLGQQVLARSHARERTRAAAPPRPGHGGRRGPRLPTARGPARPAALAADPGGGVGTAARRARGARRPRRRALEPTVTTTRRTPCGGWRPARSRSARCAPDRWSSSGTAAPASCSRSSASPCAPRTALSRPTRSSTPASLGRSRVPGSTSSPPRTRRPQPQLRTALDAGGTFPQWTERRPRRPGPLRRGPHDGRRRRCARAACGYWLEPLPPPTDWPDAPCVYLRTSLGLRRRSCARPAPAGGHRTPSSSGTSPASSTRTATAAALLGLLRPVVPDL